MPGKPIQIIVPSPQTQDDPHLDDPRERCLSEDKGTSISVLVSLEHHGLTMIVPVLERCPEALPASGCSEEVSFGVLVFTFEEIVNFPHQGNPTRGFHDTIFSLNHN